MNRQAVKEWREETTSILAETQTDVKWIKDNLQRLNSQQADLEKKVSWLQGMGAVVGVVLGSALALVINIIME